MSENIIFGIFAFILLTQTSCGQSGRIGDEGGLAKMKTFEFFENQSQRDLAEAAAAGDVKAMRRLIDEGVDVNLAGNYGMRPLSWAFLKGSIEGYSFLLKAGADPNFAIQSKGKSMPFMQLVAIESNSVYLEKALEHGGNANTITDDGDRTIIFEAIMSSEPENVMLLVRHNADLNTRDRAGSTPLLVAASVNNYHTVFTLLEHGADPLAKDNLDYNLIDFIKHYGSKGIHKNSPEYGWLLKVVEKLGIEVSL